ncbi:MAG: RNA 2',3'-cyclic phosphodiesterase [Halopseudomonas sp.]
MRLFTSIEPPAAMQQALAQICYGLPRIRWAPPEQLHLTLVFIGEVQPALLEPIIEQLGKIHFEPFRLECQGLGSFRSGVLWLGVEPQPQLLALQQSLLAQLRPLEGLRLESRRYHPHITLGRMHRRHPPDLQHFLAEHQQQHFSFEVDRFELKSSVLSAERAQHRSECSFAAQV